VNNFAIKHDVLVWDSI